MKQIQIFLLSAVLILALTVFGQDTKSVADASAPAAATSERAPGTVFRDCPDCPEMVVIPAGNFTMGSSASEKTWAATHGWDSEQHKIPLRSVALAVADE